MTQARDYIPNTQTPAKPLKPSEVVPSSKYIERGTRWMEKEEAVSLRQAMEDMDLRDELKALPDKEPENEEERRIYEAALNEAAELVWRHQNPGKIPQPGAAYRYKPHLRKNSYQHARAASAGLYGGEEVMPTGLARDSTARSVSGSSSSSGGFGSVRSRSSINYSRKIPGEHEPRRESLERAGRSVSTESKKGKTYGGIMSGATFAAPGHRRRSSMKRDISGGIQKPFSGDQIWEEPESQTNTPQKPAERQAQEAEPLRTLPRNPLNRVQLASGKPPAVEADSPPSPPPKSIVSKTEIHRNPPSQSRNPLYTKNTPSSTPPPPNDPVPRIQGVEVRSEDIRQATSMKLSDRSAKLPTPSAVSDTPGRAIVSFDKNWRPAEEVAADKKVMPEDVSNRPSTIKFARRNPFARRNNQPTTDIQPQQQQPQKDQAKAVIPTVSVAEVLPPKEPIPNARSCAPSIQINDVSVPAIPHIAVFDAVSDKKPNNALPPIPSIAVFEADNRKPNNNAAPPIPTIMLPGDDNDDEDKHSHSAPSIPVLVTPDDTTSTTKPSSRPLPTPGANTSPHRRGHWSAAPPPSHPPASTRSSTLCGECYQPIIGRFVSLAGVTARFHPACFRCYTCGTPLEALEISPEPDTHRESRLSSPQTEEDADPRLRFYCHLDWHELFAPRCGSCTTPIHGEHVFALNKHYHFGHFFCAECGDPFTQGMTHIEKDGYAWCVSCQTKRTERRAPKCRACRGPVVGSFIRALGGEWHDECFRCGVCGGGFGDGQVFPVEGRGVVCTGCRVRELKA
jgi:hypothetical protein